MIESYNKHTYYINHSLSHVQITKICIGCIWVSVMWFLTKGLKPPNKKQQSQEP